MEYGTINILTARSLGLLAGLGIWLGVGADTAPAQTSSIVWKEIGDPGNQAWDDPRYPNVRFRGYGRVDNAYRMSETELTTDQWVEFVRAYGPYADNPFDLDLLGISISGRYVDGELVYTVNEGHEGVAAMMSWRYAARFSNWMHNGQTGEAWAFERGAYDTSTFTRNDDGSYNDQDTRSPGARYWIPSMDEWMKGAYYDPDRYGEGKPGWWDQPNSSNEPLISARPEDGGQTNAGLADRLGWGPYLRAGLYPDERSPWGLLDLSGGWSEWTEEWRSQKFRYTRGSNIAEDWFWPEMDAVQADGWYQNPEGSPLTGVRIATLIPSPGGAAMVAVFTVFFARTRRRR